MESRNKWGATPLDNAKFADHMGSIALLATDAATRKAAETKLVLERKLRPTEEEREQKLAELASDAQARRDASRMRSEDARVVKEATEAAAKERAQAERRQRNADKALAAVLDAPVRGNRPAASPLGAATASVADDELGSLEVAVREARDAGNASAKGAAAERLRAAEVRLDQLRTEAAACGLPTAPAASGRNSHRTPTTQKESPIERTLRKQRLASMKRR